MTINARDMDDSLPPAPAQWLSVHGPDELGVRPASRDRYAAVANRKSSRVTKDD